MPVYPQCGHFTNAYRCMTLKMTDLKNFHKTFYSNKNKKDQDNFLIKYCTTESIKRPRGSEGKKPKSLSIKYTIRETKCGRLVPVCRQTFLDILQVKKGRVLGVLKRHHKDGGCARETRGGDRHSNTFAERRTSVINFIKSLVPLEVHYCRSSIKVRKYLSSELNISKLWKLYCDKSSPNLKVKLSYFRNIFNTKFNIGFGRPRSDVCSRCIELTEKIKYEANTELRNELMFQKTVHKRRAKAFFDFLRQEKSGLLTISFDCQKNQVLPKVPDQSAYYSRQLYIYNFTAVIGSSTSKLTKENVFIFTWTEDERPKGSNEIASAIFYLLTSVDLHGIDTIRLMADGCGGQNKNSTFIGMCLKWFETEAPNMLGQIEIIFPITGHSFLPADRVFAKIEKEIKGIEVILNPDQYINIFENYGQVFQLGKSIPVRDWKTYTQRILKPLSQWHFKFNLCKRFILIKHNRNLIKIRGEPYYRNDISLEKTVYKRGMSADCIDPVILSASNNLKAVKVKDVKNLLRKHFGENWNSIPDLKYYKDIFDRHNQSLDAQEAAIILDDVEICQFYEESAELLV